MVRSRESTFHPSHESYRWWLLANVMIGTFMAVLDATIVNVGLPKIMASFGVGIDKIEWVVTAYMLAMAVMLPTSGWLADKFGYKLVYFWGLLLFTFGSFLCGKSGDENMLIISRVIQGLGAGAIQPIGMAIITREFPPNQRGLALGINMVAAVAGSFIGLIIGGILAEIGWRWVFIANIPFGLAGTIWAYIALREIGIHKAAKIDWLGNITFAVGLTLLLLGIVAGIAPSSTSGSSWTSPIVLGLIISGIVLLIAFVFAELHIKEPMFRMSLFRIRSFTAGNLAGMLSAIGRGGLQVMIVIWLQGIWLPMHGYSFAVTPLWAGIYMLPIAAGFLIAGPISGRISDIYGPRLLATGGMILCAVTFALLMLLPADFPYYIFAILIFLNGIASGLFISPNTAAIMNSVPPESRGVASGMRAAFVNVGAPLSIALYFTLMTIGLNATVPQALFDNLTQNGISAQAAANLSHLPAVGYLFAALLGYNPLGSLLGQDVLNSLPAAVVDKITSRTFFPQLISGPFQSGFAIVMVFSIVICLIAAAASWMRGEKYIHEEAHKN